MAQHSLLPRSGTHAFRTNCRTERTPLPGVHHHPGRWRKILNGWNTVDISWEYLYLSRRPGIRVSSSLVYDAGSAARAALGKPLHVSAEIQSAHDDILRRLRLPSGRGWLASGSRQERDIRADFGPLPGLVQEYAMSPEIRNETGGNWRAGESLHDAGNRRGCAIVA